jgi:Uma2 family endonuclease
MGAIIQDKNWTYQDYLKLDDEKRYEVINGELIMVPAPSYGHQSLQSKLGLIFANFTNKNNLGEILYAPFDVILAENIVVQPDILFVAKENKELLKDRGLFGPPDLAVEIISPSSLKRDIKDKRQIYEKFAVKEYWVVFPKEKIIEVLAINNEGKYEVFDFTSLEDEQSKTFIKSKLFADLEINMNDLF